MNDLPHREEYAATPNVASWVQPAGPLEARELRTVTVPHAARQARTIAYLAIGVGLFLLLLNLEQVANVDPIYAFALLLVATLVHHLFANPLTQLTDEERAELAGFEHNDRWIVELTLIQDHTITGRDRGLLWYEQGILYFAGSRTSFSIGRDDAEVFGLPIKRLRGLRGSFNVNLRRPSGGFILASIDPIGERHQRLLDLVPSYRDSQREAVVSRLHLLVNRGLNRVHGQLPPLTDGPGRPTYACLFGWLIATWLWQFACATFAIAFLFFVTSRLLILQPFECFWLVFAVSFLHNIPARIAAIFGRVRRDLRQLRRRPKPGARRPSIASRI